MPPYLGKRTSSPSRAQPLKMEAAVLGPFLPGEGGRVCSHVPDVRMCEKKEGPFPGTSQRNGPEKWETINPLGIWKPRAIQLPEIVNMPPDALSQRDFV